MSTKQLLNVRVALSVVVYFSISGCFAFGKKQAVSPQALIKASSSCSGAIKQKNSISGKDLATEEPLVLDVESLYEQMEELQAKLEERDYDLALMHKELDALASKENASHPYLQELAKVNKTLALFKKKLDALKKAQKDQPSVVTDINVVVNPSIKEKEAAGSFGFMFQTLMKAIKYFGPSAINLYLVRAVFNLMQEHKAEVAAMAATMANLAQQAAAAAAAQNQPDSAIPDPIAAPGLSLFDAFSSITMLSMLVPVLISVVEHVPSLFATGGKVLGGVPAAYRIIGGEKIPLR